jgi:uncharacterized protein (UPF0332 family)
MGLTITQKHSVQLNNWKSDKEYAINQAINLIGNIKGEQREKVIDVASNIQLKMNRAELTKEYLQCTANILINDCSLKADDAYTLLRCLIVLAKHNNNNTSATKTNWFYMTNYTASMNKFIGICSSNQTSSSVNNLTENVIKEENLAVISVIKEENLAVISIAIADVQNLNLQDKIKYRLKGVEHYSKVIECIGSADDLKIELLDILNDEVPKILENINTAARSHKSIFDPEKLNNLLQILLNLHQENNQTLTGLIRQTLDSIIANIKNITGLNLQNLDQLLTTNEAKINQISPDRLEQLKKSLNETTSSNVKHSSPPQKVNRNVANAKQNKAASSTSKLQLEQVKNDKILQNLSKMLAIEIDKNGFFALKHTITEVSKKLESINRNTLTRAQQKLLAELNKKIIIANKFINLEQSMLELVKNDFNPEKHANFVKLFNECFLENLTRINKDGEQFYFRISQDYLKHFSQVLTSYIDIMKKELLNTTTKEQFMVAFLEIIAVYVCTQEYMTPGYLESHGAQINLINFLKIPETTSNNVKQDKADSPTPQKENINKPTQASSSTSSLELEQAENDKILQNLSKMLAIEIDKNGFSALKNTITEVSEKLESINRNTLTRAQQKLLAELNKKIIIANKFINLEQSMLELVKNDFNPEKHANFVKLFNECFLENLTRINKDGEQFYFRISQDYLKHFSQVLTSYIDIMKKELLNTTTKEQFMVAFLEIIAVYVCTQEYMTPGYLESHGAQINLINFLKIPDNKNTLPNRI